METRTFFHDETKNFRTPNEVFWGDTMHLYFRTGRYQAESVVFVADDEEFILSWEYGRNGFDYYSMDYPVGTDTVKYYFRVKAEGEEFYYGRNGVVYSRDAVIPFSIIPGFSVPEWSKGALMYQIFPDRFRNGDPSNDVRDDEYIYMEKSVRHFDWNKSEEASGVWDFCGGDLKGVVDSLEYLKGLGVEVIYLNPLFTSPSNHKYDIADYDNIDPHFGSNDIFEELVKKAHDAGMRVIPDGVFNHCSCDNAWMNKKQDPEIKDGAYGNPESPHHDFFTFMNPECTEYECWWNIATLPKLNYEGSCELEEEVMRIAKKWISPPFNADGWRVDVAADIGHSEEFNHLFWKKFRQTVKACGDDKLIFAEHYGDPSAWLDGTEWDSVMNYDGFMDPVTFFFTGVEKHGDRYEPSLEGDAGSFKDGLEKGMLAFNGDSLFCAMNQLDNHDHSRFLTRTNHRIGRVSELGARAAGEDVRPYVLRTAAAFMMFWPGAPCIYYGDEAGVCGFTDPDNRRTMPDKPLDQQIYDFYSALCALRKEMPVVRQGSTRILYASDGVLVFARFDRENSVFCAFSASDEDREIVIPIWQAGRDGGSEHEELQVLMYTDRSGFGFEKNAVYSDYGNLKVVVPSRGALIIE